MDNIKNANIYWDGGYIHTDTKGLTGKHLKLQKKLIKAVKKGYASVWTDAMDELPIRYVN